MFFGGESVFIHVIRRPDGSYGFAFERVNGEQEMPAPPPRTTRLWWEILGVDPSAEKSAIRRAYKALAKIHHPDTPGGDHKKMAEINAAYDTAKQLLRR